MRIRGLRNVGPLLRVPLASSLGGFYRRRARDVLTLSKRTAAAVPAGHKPRHSTMRPGDAVAPAPEVGVTVHVSRLIRALYLSLRLGGRSTVPGGCPKPSCVLR